MNKKLMVLLLLLSMLVAFAACKKDSDQGGAGGAYDETFSFSAMINSRGVDNSVSPAHIAWREKMAELMGMNIDLDIDYVPDGEYDDKIRIMISSGDLPDYFLLPFLYDYGPMARDGMLLDFSGYNMPNYMSMVNQSFFGRETAFMADGTMPVIVQVILPITDPSNMPIFQTNAMWNYTAFQREGITIPQTLDELHQSAQLFKEKYPSSFPINVNYAGIFAFFHAHHMYANTNGPSTLYWNGNEFTFAGLQPQYREAVEYVRMLVSEGLFDPEYIIDTPDTIKTKMMNEENFMLLNAWRTHATEYTRDSGGSQVFVNAFVPDNPRYGKAWQSFSRDNQVSLLNWTVHAVSSSFAEPELMAKFLDFQFIPEVYEISSWGIEGVTYTVQADGSKRYVDEFFEADDYTRVTDQYGLWNDRSGRAEPTLRLIQHNTPREISFPTNDYNYFGGVYEESPTQTSTFFRNASWPNEYVPPHYDAPPVQLTEDEHNQASIVLTQMETFGEQMQAGFIAGEIGMEEWERYMNDFLGYEYQMVLNIYNAAARRLLGN